MWEPRRLTTLRAFTVCYRDSFTFFYLYALDYAREESCLEFSVASEAMHGVVERAGKAKAPPTGIRMIQNVFIPSTTLETRASRCSVERQIP
jgi:hypothetical protein